MKFSRSTAHRINRPAVIALALAALRLRLHIPAPPKPDTRKTEPLELSEARP